MRARNGILISVVSSLVTTLAVLGLLFAAGAAIAGKGGPATEGGREPGAAPAVAPAPDVPAPDEGPQSIYTYYNVPGAMLQPRTSSTVVTYDTKGCVHTSSGTDRLIGSDLHVPDGATLKYLRLYFNNTSTSGNYLNAYLTKYDGGRGVTDTVTLTATTTLGWGYAVSSQITETVDNEAYTYVAYARANTNDPLVQICGLRTAYLPPLGYLHLLPLELRNQANP